MTSAPNENTVKLCKDCEHCRPFVQRILFWKVTDLELAKCAVVGVNLSSGRPKQFCDLERQYGTQCGKEGKLWTAK